MFSHSSDKFQSGFDDIGRRSTNLGNFCYGTSYSYDTVKTCRDAGHDIFAAHRGNPVCSDTSSKSNNSSSGGWISFENSSSNDWSSGGNSSSKKSSDDGFRGTADICEKMLALGPAPIGWGSNPNDSAGYCGQQLRMGKKTDNQPYFESDYVHEPTMKSVKLKTFTDNFNKELTKDLIANGPPSNPASVGFTVISAALNALDNVERSELETNVRDIISIFPVIGQIELLERINENSYQNVIHSFKKAKEQYMKDGDSELLATAKSIIDNDFMGDSDPMIVSIIEEREK